ncbi:Proline iminopeptidase [Metamycoplasma arthritidis]|uniref:Proline iminopeptidase n=1 Tax=Metamycoplasma arthritidis (strain 158L3-1) TaxID=243272 RepID=B3PN07_META1|nr:prolyl aminopeptidase [Metamycoplasma arthritidis]ACF07409.1 proline iminopeptidase [Metamycoplasma arthritidis 158L3-1]VEU78931.1 Proline iminopeptidase [Metamycoplasma arthritidis]
MYSLFNEIEPYNSGLLEVSDLHKIYYEESGNPQGQPILYVHGGPGAGTDSKSRQYFDPAHYRIIVFDQRGCGKSIPSAEIRENTTWTLVEDIEKLRKHLKIDSWILFGGSWGSCLSLIYAINYPHQTKALILRGIYLGREADNKFLYYEGSSKFWPEAYQEFISFIPEEERNNLIKAYHKYLNHQDPNIAAKAAYHWAKWELGMVALRQIPMLEEILSDSKATLEIARLECHFFFNNLFLDDDNYILNNVDKIANIPTIIVHGRYDMVCMPEAAYLLAKQLNKCSLRFIDESGHSSKEIGIASALVQATEEMKKY